MSRREFRRKTSYTALGDWFGPDGVFPRYLKKTGLAVDRHENLRRLAGKPGGRLSEDPIDDQAETQAAGGTP